MKCTQERWGTQCISNAITLYSATGYGDSQTPEHPEVGGYDVRSVFVGLGWVLQGVAPRVVPCDASNFLSPLTQLPQDFR